MTALPDYWDYNAVRVEGPDPGIAGFELLAAAEELQHGLPHRRVEVEDRAAGERLRDAFAHAGWVGERLVWMRRSGPPPDGATGSGVAIEEAAFAATRELRARWHRGDTWVGDDAAVERFLALEEAVAERRRPRAFVARAAGGEPVGFVSLWTPEGAGATEVEQAYVAPGQRSAGVGAALISAALAAVAQPVQWIVADDEGRPKALYRRLGFLPAWIQHGFVRRPRRGDASGRQSSRRPPA